MNKTFTPFAEYIKERSAAEEQDGAQGEFQIQDYRAGDVIFFQGDRGHAAYVIKSGQVEISVKEDGEKTVLTLLGEQAVFGEVALLTGEHVRSATATAVKDARVIRIPTKVFDAYLKKSPKVISACLVAIARRLNDISPGQGQGTPMLERVTRILALCQSHGAEALDTERTVETLVCALDKTPGEIMEYLSTLEALNLIERRGENSPFMHLLGGDRFLQKALKVFSLIEGR